MKHSVLLICFALLLSQCSDETPKESSPAKAIDTTALAERRQNLCGASFADTVRVSAGILFSNAKESDRFTLTVPAGLLSETRSYVQIENPRGQLLYADTFDTRYFAKFAWNPDTVPSTLKDEDYEEYLLEYVASVTKEKVERYARHKIEHFFDAIVFDRAQLGAIRKYGDSGDEPFFREITQDTSRKIVFLPCFSCEHDGRCYMGWSAKQKKVITLLLADE